MIDDLLKAVRGKITSFPSKDTIRRLNEFKAQEIMLRGLNQALKKSG